MPVFGIPLFWIIMLRPELPTEKMMMKTQATLSQESHKSDNIAHTCAFTSFGHPPTRRRPPTQHKKPYQAIQELFNPIQLLEYQI